MEQTLSPAQFNQWDTLMHRAAGNAEEVFPVSLCPSPIAFSDVERNREAGPIQLIGEIPTAAREFGGKVGDTFGKSECLLIDFKPLEDEHIIPPAIVKFER